MKSWHKKIIFILLVLIMLGTIAYFYVNRIFLPVKVKHLIEQKVSEITQRPATIERISFELTKGITLKNILIREPGQNRTFLQIDEIHFNVLLAPFLRHKTIVIPSVSIRRPITQITHYEDGSFNFSPILAKKAKKKGKYSIFITKFRIIDGSVDYLKKGAQNDFSENFRHIQLDVAISLDKQLNYQLKTDIPTERSKVLMTGIYTIGTRNFKAALKLSNINLVKYLSKYFRLPDFTLNKGILSSADINFIYENYTFLISGNAHLKDATMQWGNNKNLSGNIRLLNTNVKYTNNILTADGELRLPSTRFEFAQDKIVEGDIQSNIRLLTWDKKKAHLKANVKVKNSLLTLNNKQRFSGQITSREVDLNYSSNDLRLFGDFDFTDAHITFSPNKIFKGHLTTKNTSVTYANKDLNIKSAIDAQDSQLTFGGNKLLNTNLSSQDFNLVYSKHLLDIKSPLQFSNAVMTFTGGSKFQGAPHLDLHFTYPVKDSEKYKIRGDLRLESGLLLGLPVVDSASNINGNIAISNDQLTTDKIVFNTENTNFELSGKLTDWDDYRLDISAYCESIELQRIKELFPKFFKRRKVDITGLAAIRLDFKGRPADVKDAQINISADLKDAELVSNKLPHPIENINGTLRYQEDEIHWSKLKGKYQNFPFRLTGKLKNFSKPEIRTTLTSKNLKINSDINLYTNAIRFNDLILQYLDSNFEGDVDLYIDQIGEPDIQVKGEGVINVEDILTIDARLRDKIDSYQLSGIIDADIFFKGKIKQWRDWSLTVNGKSPVFNINGHPLRNFKINYLQRDKNISKLNISSQLYDGKLNVSSSVNIEGNNYPFKMDLGIFDLNIAEWVQSKDIKNKKLAGNLNLNLDLIGEALNQSTFEGSGKYEIEDGYIWQLRIIEGLSSMMLIPEFANTVYTSSEASFLVKNRRITTNNLILRSNTMKLRANGWIDFDKRISFDVTPKLSEITLIQSESIKKWTSSFVAKNINLIKVSGTLGDPKYKAEATPLKIITDTTGAITEGIGGVIEGVFNPKN